MPQSIPPVYAIALTQDEYNVLTRFLRRLTSDTSWLNYQWLDDAGVHEVSVMHALTERLRERAEAGTEGC